MVPAYAETPAATDEEIREYAKKRAQAREEAEKKADEEVTRQRYQKSPEGHIWQIFHGCDSVWHAYGETRPEYATSQDLECLLKAANDEEIELKQEYHKFLQTLEASSYSYPDYAEDDWQKQKLEAVNRMEAFLANREKLCDAQSQGATHDDFAASDIRDARKYVYLHCYITATIKEQASWRAGEWRHIGE